MALTEINTKSIKDGEVKSADIADSAVTLAKIENGTTSDAGKFLKNNDGAAPSWATVDLTTFNSATTFNEDATFVGETNDSNTRNVVWDASDESLALDDWTYLKFRTTNNSNSGAFEIYSVSSELRFNTQSVIAAFWGEGIHGRNSINGWSGDWFYVGTNASADDQTKLYNGRNSKVWQSKTWGAEYVTTGAVKIPNGTTAQRPTATLGQLRYNTTTNSFEGYQGASAAWGSLGGGAKGNGGNQIFYENGKTIDYDYTVVSTVNAMTAGPVEIAATGNGDSSSVEVVVESGATWTIV